MNALRLWCCAVVVATLAPCGAAAGVRFDFATEVTGYAYSGRMSIDGTRARVDITQGSHPLFNPNVSIISRSGGKEIVVLDHAQKTYFVRNMANMGGHLPATRGIGQSTALKPHIRKSRIAGTPIDGVATERHVLHADYELSMVIEGETLKGSVQLEATFDVAPQIRQHALPWGLQFAAKTGFDNIDHGLAGRIPARLPLRQFVSVSRRIADGPLVTETITTTASNVRTEEMTDEDFLAPRGYRYKEPVFEFGSR
jgi:hypothetical protein